MWEYEIAKKLKEKTKAAQEKAVDLSKPTVGTVESVNPMTISTFDAEGMFDESNGEIVFTRTFSEYFKAKEKCSISGVHGTAVCNGKHCCPDIKKGTQVLVIAVGDNKIAVIDLIGGRDVS